MAKLSICPRLQEYIRKHVGHLFPGQIKKLERNMKSTKKGYKTANKNTLLKEVHDFLSYEE